MVSSIQRRRENVSESSTEKLTAAFMENRERLLALVRKNLNPVLLKRYSHEDILSMTYEAAAKRLAYFASHPNVPAYFKLRTILFQTLADIARRDLQAAGRDAYKEVARVEGVARCESFEQADGESVELEFASDVTSPVSRVDRDERYRLLRSALATLSEDDRRILVLRHFDGLGNSECAAILGIEIKAASIRYVRALERLQKKLLEISCFRKN